MFALSCASQNYAWGRIGEESIIAKLKAASDPSFTLEATKPYAELWMGTHVNGPSKLADGTPLLDWLQANPASVGQLPEGYAPGDLPFFCSKCCRFGRPCQSKHIQTSKELQSYMPRSPINIKILIINPKWPLR